MSAQGQGYGKLLLFGEHAAVHGFPAVGMALPQQTRVRLGEPFGQATPAAPAAVYPAGAASFRALGWQIHGLFPRHHAVFRQLLQELYTLMPEAAGLVDELQHLSITSEVPFESGFGSSGALSAALLRAFGEALGRTPDPDTLWEQANTLEAIFHGTPSGIDTGLAVFGGCLAFRFSGQRSGRSLSSGNRRASGSLPHRERLPEPGIPLLIGAIPRSASTRELIAEVQRRLETDPTGVGLLLTELGQHAETAIELMSSSSATPASIGSHAAQAQSELTRLGVSTRELQETFAQLYSLGAIGCKLSGAGGGGAFYAVFPDHAQCHRAAETLRSALAQRYPQGGWHVLTTH